MDPGVFGQLRVKTRAEDVSLLYRHDIPVTGLGQVGGSREHTHDLDVFRSPRSGRRILGFFRGRDDDPLLLSLLPLDAIDTGEDLIDDGRADEDGVEGAGGRVDLVQEIQPQVGLEAFDLAAEVVPVHANVETADEVLTPFLGRVGRLGQEDQSGARAPRRLPVNPFGAGA